MSDPTGTINNPTLLTTNDRKPLCFYCLRYLLAKSGLHWCDSCNKWFRVRRQEEAEVVPVTVMI